jgi:D-alanyl-D-alanine carboxypeptidase
MKIPDDAVVTVEKDNGTLVVTFKIPATVPHPGPGASYYARIVMDAATGKVLQRFVPDA